MKHVIMFLAGLGFILGEYSTFAREQNIIYDGLFDFSWKFNNGSGLTDTASIFIPEKKGTFRNRPVKGSGDIQEGDLILAINGIPYLRSDRDGPESHILDAGPASVTFEFDVYRNSLDSVIRIPVTKGTDIARKFPLRHIDYFVDSSGNLTLKDILRDPVQDLFVNDAELKDMIYAASSGARCIWLRVNVESRLSADRTYVLVFSASDKDSISTYFRNPNMEWITQYAGMAFPEDLRGFVYKDWSAVQLHLSNRGMHTMYARVCSDNFANLRNSYIQSMEYLHEKNRNERTTFSLLAGMMVLIILFCILIYLFTRARSYLLFFLFVTGYILLALVETRYLGELDRTFPYTLSRGLYYLIYMLPVMFFLFFGMNQLETRRHHKFWHYVVRITLGLVIFSAALLTLGDLLYNHPGYNRILSITSNINGITCNYLSYFILLIPSLLSIKKRKGRGWYMLMASLFFIVLNMAEDILFPGSSMKSLAFGLNSIDTRITLLNSVESVGIIVMFLIFATGPYRS